MLALLTSVVFSTLLATCTLANPAPSKGFKIQTVTSDSRFKGQWLTYFQPKYDRNYNKSENSPNAPLVFQPQLGLGELCQFAGSNNNELIMSNVNYSVNIFALSCENSNGKSPSGAGYNYIEAGDIEAGAPFTPTSNLTDKAGLLIWSDASWQNWAVCQVNGIKGFTKKTVNQLLWRQKGGGQNKTACADVSLKLIPYST